MDLDGAVSPSALVTRILKLEPNLTAPIPIEKLSELLDIEDICELTTTGFEGGLITNTTRSHGIILVHKDARGGRRRFTIGHELGHFLMPHHKQSDDGFQCSRSDMSKWDGKEKSEAVRYEVEANEFASLMLMPPPIWRKSLERRREPSLEHVQSLASEFGVSKEAAARNYALYRDETLAIVAVKDGKIAKIYRKSIGFPSFCVTKGDPVPLCSRVHREKKIGTLTDFDETFAGQWLKSDWGKQLPTLCEQVLIQKDGFALIMLEAETNVDEDERDPDEDRTAKQRYQDRKARWQERR
jgi:Zn-dependent peptidase ImmA (M78 family)